LSPVIFPHLLLNSGSYLKIPLHFGKQRCQCFFRISYSSFRKCIKFGQTILPLYGNVQTNKQIEGNTLHIIMRYYTFSIKLSWDLCDLSNYSKVASIYHATQNSCMIWQNNSFLMNIGSSYKNTGMLLCSFKKNSLRNKDDKVRMKARWRSKRSLHLTSDTSHQTAQTVISIMCGFNIFTFCMYCFPIFFIGVFKFWLLLLSLFGNIVSIGYQLPQSQINQNRTMTELIPLFYTQMQSIWWFLLSRIQKASLFRS